MKLRLYIMTMAFVAVLSCTPENFDKGDAQKECISLNIYNTSMDTKVSDPGTENERLITRLDLFFYTTDAPDGDCVMYVQRNDLGSSGRFTIPLYVQESEVNELFPTTDKCTLYAIANLPESIVISGTETKKELEKLLITSDEFKGIMTPQGTAVPPKQFIMTGYADVDRNISENTITGTLALKRAATKINMSFKLPTSLVVDLKDMDNQPVRDPVTGDPIKETWVPYFKNNNPQDGIQMMHMGMHKGIYRTYLDGTNQELINEDNIFETGYTESITYTGTDAPEDGGYHNYKCDVTFYSYPFSWEEGADDLNAPYFTIMIPWRRDTDDESQYQTYYYQVVVNGSGKELVGNTWYDITLKVGVLGSRVETAPVYISEDLTFRAIDWSESTALESAVDLNEWQYLIVPEHRVEMNNTNIGSLGFEASHPIGWVLEWPTDEDVQETLDDLESYNTRNLAAYYINNREKTPIGTQLTDITNNSFSLASSGKELVFKHDIPENVYSPIYVHLKLWLDIDGNGRLGGDEVNFVEHVTFVQYPPIYITPSKSVAKSIFVNGYYTAINGSDSNDDIKINDNNSYNLGRIPGTSDSGDHMYVISVSKFEEDDVFTLDGKTYQYLIGDPRVTESDINLNNDRYDMTQGDGAVNQNRWPKGWVLANDVNGERRMLEHYYPTAEQGDVFRVIAPKFRIVSFLSSGYSYITPEGAKMRCASFQENGYPAGRWRLPTYAEIQYVISLQNKQVIQDIFYSSNYYYSSTHLVQNSSSGSSYKDIADNSTGSVRCVYDEWYWGENSQDANTTNVPAGVEGGFSFTWGDKER